MAHTKRAGPSTAQSIPPLTRLGINNYVLERIPPGDFLEAVLCNDLKGAMATADSENLLALPAIVAYIHNRTPAECHGSPVRYRKWLANEEKG